MSGLLVIVSSLFNRLYAMAHLGCLPAEDSSASFLEVNFSSDRNQICHLVHRLCEDQVFIHSKKLREKYNFRGMEEELNEEAANPQAHDILPELDQPILAYNDEKLKYCRGRVSNLKNKYYLIYFVDYGNSELKCADEIFVLPLKFLKIPVMACKCSLIRAEEVDLKELDQNKEFNCNFLSDSEPYRIVLRSPDSSASFHYETVSLEKGKEYEVTVTHVVNVHEFYVRWKKFSKVYDLLRAKLQLFGDEEDSSDKMSSGAESKICAVYSTKEQMWLRGLVSFFSPVTSPVTFVDVGSMDDMCFIKSVKPLPPDLIDMLPAQAIRCRLEGIPADVSVPAKHLNEIFCNIVTKSSSLRIRVVKMEENIAEVILFDEEDKTFTVNHKILFQIGASIAREIPRPVLHRTETIFVTHFKSFREFFGQLTKISLGELCELEELLHAHGSAAPPCVFRYQADRAEGWSAVGQVCCAEYGVDGKYYRGKIVSHTSSEAEVLFVDYGNTEKFNTFQVKALTAELAAKPQMGFMCCADETLRFETVVSDLRDAMLNQTLEVKILEDADERGIFKVEFTQAPCNEQVLKLLQPNPEVPQPKQIVNIEPSLRFTNIPFGYKENAVLVHLRNWKHLYFQLPKFQADLDHVGANVQLAAKYGKRFSGVIVRDAACIAKFSHDKVWYRGQVLDLFPGDKYLVEFVDYGNRDVVHHSNICLIPDHLMDIPKLALECRLFDHPEFEIPEDILLDFESRALNETFRVEFKKFKSHPETVFVRFADTLGVTLIQLFTTFAAKLSQPGSDSRSRPKLRGSESIAREAVGSHWSPDRQSKFHDGFKNEGREYNDNPLYTSRGSRETKWESYGYESEYTGVRVRPRESISCEKKVRPKFPYSIKNEGREWDKPRYTSRENRETRWESNDYESRYTGVRENVYCEKKVRSKFDQGRSNIPPRFRKQ